MRAVDELVGAVVAERYLVRKFIGQGGIGTVYKVTDEHLERFSALKVLLPKLSSNPKHLNLLEHEAKTTAKLRHPNIVTIYDHGKFDGLSYMVSEYVEGCSLRDVLAAQKGPLRLDQVLRIAVRVGEALGYAHGVGIVHRDIKPSNILLSRSGDVLLSDFGLATVGGQSALGEPGVIMGTRAYMSPEQAFGKDIDLRSDIYSLGIVIYECLTGKRPFARDTSSAVAVTAAMDWSATPLSSLNNAVPSPVEAVVLKALSQNREERFASVASFTAALAEAAGGTHETDVIDLVRDADESVRGPDTAAFAAERVLIEGPVPAGLSLVVVSPEARKEFDPRPKTFAAASPPAPAAPSIGYLLVRTPDGKQETVELNRDRLTLGRSSTCELCYPEDAGLSRQHLAFERRGSEWLVCDLGSKNGFTVNGNRISAPMILRPGNRVTAGHLIIEALASVPWARDNVVFDEIEPADDSSSVISNLVLSEQELPVSGDRQMQALIRAGRELGGHRPLAELFDLIMDLSLDAVGATRGVLMTLEGDELIVRAAKGEGFRISRTVRERVLNTRESLLIRDTRLDDAFADRVSILEQHVRSILAVPLQTENRIIGLIYVDSPLIREFTKEDLNLLTVMANVAAVRIEQGRLSEMEQAERLMARDLDQAADIQRSLLPNPRLRVPGLDIYGTLSRCRTVGGDYFDFISYEDGKVAVLLGDVSGKGMPAALLMSSLQARVQVLFEYPMDLAMSVARLNRIMAANCPANRFITFFIGVLNPVADEMVYVNAGHNPPLLVRGDGKIEHLEGTGMILGILPQGTYQQRTCPVNPGDTLVFFSDGVTEAARLDTDEEFGEERLATVVNQHRHQTAEQIANAILETVNEFTTGSPLADDMTLMVARREPLVPRALEVHSAHWRSNR